MLDDWLFRDHSSKRIRDVKPRPENYVPQPPPTWLDPFYQPPNRRPRPPKPSMSDEEFADLLGWLDGRNYTVAQVQATMDKIAGPTPR